MHNHTTRATERLESLLDQICPCLSEHLNRDIVRNSVVLNQLAHKIEVMARGRRESHLNFLKANFDQLLPQQQFLVRRHRFYQSLITITQINTAPARRLFNHLIRPAPIRHGNGLKGPVFVVIEAVHRVSPVIL